MNYRTVYCDEWELRFDHEREHVFMPGICTLTADVAANKPWHWNHKGLVRVLPVSVMQNALDIYTSWETMKNRREAVPKEVGRFLWSQTVSVEDQADQLP